MKTRAVIGWLLLAAAAAWLARRYLSGAKGPSAAASPSGQLSIGQVGATIREDSTPDLVKLFADYTGGIIANTLCWRRQSRDFDGANVGWEWWIHTDGRTTPVPPGGPYPTPRCDGV